MLRPYDGAAFGCLSSFDWATLDAIDLEALSTAPIKGKPAAAPAHLAPTKSAALDFGMRYFIENNGTGQEGRGLKYMVHSKYCLAMGEKYREYLAGRRVLKVPMKIVVERALLDLKPTEEEHAEVANFPYRELVGTIAFPTCRCGYLTDLSI